MTNDRILGQNDQSCKNTIKILKEFPVHSEFTCLLAITNQIFNRNSRLEMLDFD